MREKVFRFKQFSVTNDRSAMKVGSDGVLLGAWCDVTRARRVLDVGTGCGVIALMIAQRNRSAIIRALDIDEPSCQEAVANFGASPWTDRLLAQCVDFNVFTSRDNFDLIVSNPPYFSAGVLPEGEGRITARHTIALTYSALLARAATMLAPAGKIAIITPTDAYTEVIEAATMAGLRLARHTTVCSVEGKEPIRTLWEMTNVDTSLCRDTLAICDAHGSFTSKYVALTRDFYLKMQ